MKKSKKIMLCIAQVAIIALFIGLAAGSSDQDMASFSSGFNQGMACQNAGYVYIGNYSNSDCWPACKRAGYKDYCTGTNTYWCGCQ